MAIPLPIGCFAAVEGYVGLRRVVNDTFWFLWVVGSTKWAGLESFGNLAWA